MSEIQATLELLKEHRIKNPLVTRNWVVNNMDYSWDVINGLIENGSLGYRIGKKLHILDVFMSVNSSSKYSEQQIADRLRAQRV